MGIAVPVIKTEKEQFEMSPLRDDCFNIDLQSDHDHHKYLADPDNTNIKIEPDMDCLDFCLNEGLEGLMGNYSFENDSDIKPDIKSNEKDFSPTSPTTPLPVSTTTRSVLSQQQQPTAVPTGKNNSRYCIQVSRFIAILFSMSLQYLQSFIGVGQSWRELVGVFSLDRVQSVCWSILQFLQCQTVSSNSIINHFPMNPVQQFNCSLNSESN